MKNLFKLQWVVALLMAVTFVSCSSDDDPTPSYPSLKGFFLINEGSFGQNNGSVSFYGEDGTIDKDIFSSVNGSALGDIVQDFAVVDTLGFVVVNNSQKVEVVRMRDFKSVATISGTDVTYPRFVAQATDNTVYISNGANAGEVLIYDYNKLEFAGKITVGNGPEMMVKVGDKMYVANSGGWGVDNTISVIDINESKVIETIDVHSGSVTLKADKNNDLWVYSKGAWSDGYTDAKLFKIDTDEDKVAASFDIPAAVGTYGSNLLATSKDGFVYFTSDATYKMSVDAVELPTTKWVDYAYYGLEVETKTGNVYAIDANNSEVQVLNSETAAEITKYSEVMPFSRSVYFN